MSLSNSYIFNRDIEIFTEFQGEYRSDWWGDDSDREEIRQKISEHYNHIDFLLEIRSELSNRIRDRNYPPGFDAFYYYGIYL